MVKTRKPWSLLSSHGLVLVAVSLYGDLAVLEIAGKTGLSRATVLRALQDLREARMLETRRQGRRNVYCVNTRAKFRHPILSDRRIEDLLTGLHH